MATVEHVDRTLGSAAATELLYRRHGSRVLRYCLRCLRQPADAEDALQQTFLQAHRALGRGVEPVAEATWLLTIARNVCLTRVDALRRRARVEFAEDPSVLAAMPAPTTPPELSPEIVEALARLPERQRQVLFLREWQGLSYAEIAEALGTTESAVETLLFRGRNALAVQLGAPRRRRRGFDLAAFLSGWARPFAGIAGPKLAAGAAAVVAVAAAGVATTEGTHRHGHRAPAVAAVAPAALPVYAAASLAPPATPQRRHFAAARSVRHARAVPATAPSRAGRWRFRSTRRAADSRGRLGIRPGAAAVAPKTGGGLVPPGVAPTAIRSAVPDAPPPVSPPPALAPVVAPVVAPVTAAVDATVQTAVTAVPAAAATVDQAAQDLAATTQPAPATVSTAVSKLLPGH